MAKKRFIKYTTRCAVKINEEYISSTEQILFKKLREVNNKIPWINHGGCGIMAYILAKYLKQKGKCIAIHYRNGLHILLSFNGELLDSTGYRSISYSTKITTDKLLEGISIKYQWNDTFDRSDTYKLLEIFPLKKKDKDKLLLAINYKLPIKYTKLREVYTK